jgi:Ca-activated chloride channel family protein
MSDTLQLTSLCNKSSVPVSKRPQLVYVLTELTPGAKLASMRMPLNFCLVLDRSGSMSGEKLRTMKAAVKSLIDQLDPDDMLSIITFETHTEDLLPAQRATDKAELKRLVDDIRDGGGTEMAPALQAGLQQVSTHNAPGRISRIVMLTDGEATDTEDHSRQAADQAGEMNVPIIGLGFGDEWNEEFLQDLADRSMLSKPGSEVGYIDYISTPSRADTIFQQAYQHMQVTAQNVHVNIRMVQGLEARRVWQLTPMIKDITRSSVQSRAISIPVGDLDGSGLTLMAELSLPPRPEGLTRIAQSDVVYEVPGHGQQRETVDLVINFSNDPAQLAQVDGKVMSVVERVRAHKLSTIALRDAEAGKVGAATKKLTQAVTILLGQGQNEEAAELEKVAEQLEASGEVTSEVKKTIKLTGRKTQRLAPAA